MIKTLKDFANDVCAALGAPITEENQEAFTAWTIAEYSDTPIEKQARFNPLNTTQPMAGSTPFNTFSTNLHVWNYSDYDTGVTATVRTLLNGLYQPIIDALMAGNDAIRTANAIGNSPWGTNGKNISPALVQIENNPALMNRRIAGSDMAVKEPEVSLRSQGPAVEELQTQLNNLNNAHLRVDGDFGPLTLREVRLWQEKNHLVVDGIVGPLTWATLGH